MEAPDEYWVVLLDGNVGVYLDDAAADIVRRDMLAGIVEYSDVRNLVGKPVLIPLRKILLHFHSSPQLRALDAAMEGQARAERGFDE